MRRLVLLGVVLALAGCAREPDFPKPIGHVNDFAGILTEQARNNLETQLRAFQERSTNEIAVVTVKSLGGMSVEDYTIRLARKWGVGDKKKDNGVVFLIAPAERECRIEVGYKLEPILTDIRCKQIIEDVVLRHFKAGRMSEGIDAGTQSIMAVLNGETVPRHSPQLPMSPSDSGDSSWIVPLLVIGFIVLMVVLRSRSTYSGHGGGWSSGGGFGGFSGGGGRSFGGFGGGSFGGGGASGRW